MRTPAPTAVHDEDESLDPLDEGVDIDPATQPIELPDDIAADARTRSGPLAGVVVADLSRVLAGPYCTMLLADLGATVLKVESPAGDETRGWTPPERDGVSTYYLSINRNKRSIALDFGDADDLAVVRDLVRRADVVVENFKPGGLDRFGLDHDSVSAENPGVVYASITGFGRAGGAALPGYDLLVQAASGLMDLTGDVGGTPFRAGVAVFDVMTGLHAAIGVLAALRHREATGRGQRVEVDLLSSALSGMVNQTGGYLLSGEVPHRLGNAHPSISPYEPLPTADGDLVVAVGNDRQFRALCDGIGAPALASDARFSTAPERSRNRAELRPLLVDALGADTSAAWFERLTTAGVPCAPINDVAGGVALAERLGLEPVATAGTGARAVPVVRSPITLSATAASYALAPPALDADREAVLTWLRERPTTDQEPDA